MSSQGYVFLLILYEILVLVNFVQEDQSIYATMVKNMIQEDRYRLVVNINDLRRKNPIRTARYITVYSVLTNVQHEQIVQIVKC